MDKKYQERIGYEGDIKPILEAVCYSYDIGEYKSHETKIVGYEDFNLFLETTTGEYFIKIFAKFRNQSDCQRYTNILESVSKTEINTPKLFLSSQGYLFEKKHNGHNFRLCVMEYIDGHSFFDARLKPTSKDMVDLVKQAALINAIDIKPEFVYDSWAIVNFLKEYKKKKKHLESDDLQIIEPLAKSFSELSLDVLPHCFVHGDLIATNVMKNKRDKLFVIDFAVADYYPRIVELAVLFCNMLFNENKPESSIDNYKIALREYQKTIPLEKIELKYLPLFLKIAHAIHALNGTYEKVVHRNTTEENDYWINLSRKGLGSHIGELWCQ